MKLPVRYDDLMRTERRLVREEYVRLQGGNCWYCKQPLTGQPSEQVRSKVVDNSLFPEGFFNWPVHLHHDRITGMTVGAVHARCNAVSWMYDEQ